MARLCYNTPHQIMQKLYCYVDETGQDTEGRFFLVVVVIADAAITEALKKQLLDIERDVGKQRSRWAQNRLQVRIAYLERICSLPELQDRVRSFSMVPYPKFVQFVKQVFARSRCAAPAWRTSRG
jgi:7,8-dihydro-6-hydroxymethylpterin-pyrophosphokinase